MSNMSDLIEHYLKKLLAGSERNQIEIQRSELAIRFSCVPSQINYVLTTRFTIGHGYIVESRRGGGGYIKIVKVHFDGSVNLIQEICRIIDHSISQTDAEGLIKRLRNEGLVTKREARVMIAAINRDILRLGLPMRDELRALIVKAMVTELLREE
jgi:transcriptional regulator CtsR